MFLEQAASMILVIVSELQKIEPPTYRSTVSYLPRDLLIRPKQPPVIAHASTVLFISKDASRAAPNEKQGITESNIPANEHYVDRTRGDTVVVISQPTAHRCACLGGIMALRMKTCGAKGAIVAGRVRDLSELQLLEFPV